MKEFNKKQILNPLGSDFSNKVWTGQQTGIMQLNIDSNNDLLRIGAIAGLDQFWRPESVNLTEDVNAYKELGKLQNIYNSFLAYLTFLDSVQITNIPILQYRVTCPKVKGAMAVQTMQEYLHSQSYQHMILTLIPENQRNDIYNLVFTDAVLKKRCEFIASYYQQYIDNNTIENYYLAMVANYILESLYFYSGFMFFYSIANIMANTCDMIKFIHRDEQMHVKLYERLILQASQEFDNVWLLNDKIYEMFDEAVKQEYHWFNYIAQNNVLGMTDLSMDHYLKYLANLRLKNIGLQPLYDTIKYKKNPYQHLDKIADIGSSASSKGNFFTANVTAYEMQAKNYANF